MSTNKKPRGDSTLKTLSEERQAAIAQHLAGNTLAETRKWLADDGIKTSDRALSEFFSWWQLRSQLQRNESTVLNLLENLKQAEPGISAERLDLAGQMFFTALSIEQKDSLGWKRAQDVKKNSRLVAALERRVTLAERQAEKANQAKGIMEDKELSENERAARMRQLFGIS